MITLVGMLIGAVLGTRYKALCLVPVTVTGIVALIVLDRVHGVPAGSIALSALALAAGLQLGYLFGAVMQSVLPGVLASSVSQPQRLPDQPARIS